MASGPARRGEQLQADLGHPEPRVAAGGPGPAASSSESTSSAEGEMVARAGVRSVSRRPRLPRSRGGDLPWAAPTASARPRSGQRSLAAARPAPGPAPGGRRRSPCPTWTASAPASSSSAASRPAGDAADADDRGGRGARPGTSNTARTATGQDGRAGQPAASRGRAPDGPCDGSSTRPSRVLTSVTASAPPSRAAAAISGSSGVVGLSLAHRGRRQPAVASIAARVAAAEWANMCRRSSRLGQERLTSTATTSRGARARRSAAAAVLLDRPAPDAGHDPGPGPQERRQVVPQPGRDARALEPDGVEHPGRSSGAAGAPGCPPTGTRPATSPRPRPSRPRSR